jgi:Uma2 family endonuclease
MSTATFAEPAVEAVVPAPAEPIETDDALYEVVHGGRVEMPPMSIRAVMVASRICSAMNAFAKPKRLGEAFSELLVHVPLAEDESRDRRPDVSFFCYPRSTVTSPELPDANAWDLIPDVAVEVTSPSDRAEVQRSKVLEYFRVGVRLVWVIYPKLRVVDVYETPTSVRVVGPDDALTGDPILPGFRLPLADLFAPFARPSV